MSEPIDPAYQPLPPAPGPGGFGQYGAMPPAEYGQPPAPVGPPPSSVIYAVQLMYVAAAAGLVSLIVALSTKSTLRADIAKKNPDFDSAKLNTAVNVASGAGVVFGIVFIVLFVLLALQVRKGKNWARVVTWVITGLGIVSALASLGQTVAPASRVISLVSGLLDVAIVVLLLQKPSNAFFKPRT
jgi:hypothetical protein